MLGACPPASAASGGPPPGARRVLVVFASLREPALARAGGLSLGIMSAAEGAYSTTQLLLDMSQGARVASARYPSASPPRLTVLPRGAGAVVAGWQAARRRAGAAPAELVPGLLAARISGGAAYAGSARGPHTDALLAADRGGRIAQISLGSPPTVLERAQALLGAHALVVADLPAGRRAGPALGALAAGRAAGELVIVVERVLRDERSDALLWVAAAGLAGGAHRELTSATTRENGLVSSVDIAPTVLRALAVGLPRQMPGHPLETGGPLRSAALRGLMTRLHLIDYRRLRALAVLLGAWAIVLLASAARGPRAHAGALRVGALAVMWAPPAVLVAAALEPAEQQVEYAVIVAVAFALALACDLLLRWPRAPAAPAVAAVLALAADQLAGTQLLTRSLLGPDPILGARFHGIGNELESGLAVLALTGLAAALYPARRGVLAAAAAVVAGAALAAVEGAARLGAGVGGVLIVGVGFALAAALLLGGRLKRRLAVALILAAAGTLTLLAAVDLAAAGGTGPYSGTIPHAHSAGEVRDVLKRGLTAAWEALGNHAMPAACALAVAAAAWAWHRRARLLAPVGCDPAWLAALAGGIAAGVAGALVEEAGPLLLVVAVFVLGCAGSYLWGRPPGLAPAGAAGEPAARASADAAAGASA